MQLFTKRPFSRKLIMVLTVFIILLRTTALLPTETFAQSGVEKIKGGIGSIAEGVGLTTGEDITDTDKALAVIGNVIKVLLSFLGAAFLVLIIYAGAIWMFALGDAGKVKKAQGIIRTSSIGIAVIVLSYAIVSLVLNILSEATSDIQP